MTTNRLATIALATALLLVSAGCGGTPPEQETSATTTSASSLSTTTITATSSVTATSSTTTTTPSAAPDGVIECTAAELTAPATPSELDPAAGETFRAIVDAAVACDFDELGRIAGDAITLSFGGHDDVAEFLAEGDARQETLRVLVQLMAMPPGYQEQFDTWVWPTFWEDDEPATEDEQAAIEAIYGRPFDEILVDDLGYINHRIGIDAEGEWLYFVAGD